MLGSERPVMVKRRNEQETSVCSHGLTINSIVFPVLFVAFNQIEDALNAANPWRDLAEIHGYASASILCCIVELVEKVETHHKWR